MERRKVLVYSTLAAALFLFVCLTAYHSLTKQIPIAIQTAQFPTIGNANARVEVVLIEDFQCKNCRVFSQKIIPKIQAQYIKTGKIRFTLVPVSFLAGSQLVANAALEVYRQVPKQFFPYLKSILSHEGEIKPADLIRLARRLNGGIDVAKLQNCIEKSCHQPELEKNLAWARGLMGAQFRTPALFVNGVPGSTYSFEAIRYQIDQLLEKS